jgi:hypothetical protein
MRCMLLLVLSLLCAAASAATQLAMATQPGGGTGGVPLAQQPVVEAQDSLGAVDTAFTGFVMAQITSGTGAPGAVLFGTATVSAVAGVVTFADLAIDLAGTGYTLTFMASGLAPAMSAGVDITVGPAARLAIIQQPGDAWHANNLKRQPRVAVVDAGGNIVVSDNLTVITAELVTMAPGLPILEGTVDRTVVLGVAKWNDLRISDNGQHRLRFTTSGFSPVMSSNIHVVDPPYSGDCAGQCCSTGETIDAWLMFAAAFAATAVALRQRCCG